MPTLPKLQAEDLLLGDVLVQRGPNSILGPAISLGQWLAGQGAASDFYHAGIRGLDGQIVEALEWGITAQQFTNAEIRSFCVARTNHCALRARAAFIATALAHKNATKHTLGYSAKGAIGSILPRFNTKPFDKDELGRLDRYIAADCSHPFFCSEFVALCYAYAAWQVGLAPEQVVPFRLGVVSPAKLAMMIDKSPYLDWIGYYSPS